MPESISRDTYKDASRKREDLPDWLVGCAGFLASYNGKFFGGYAGRVKIRSGRIRDYYDEARRNLQQQAGKFGGIKFECLDYRSLDPNKCVIYCDPPYKNTTGYGEFNHEEFWETMRRWSEKNVVLVSEQDAPPDFACIWEKGVVRTQDNRARKQATEKLFKFKEGAKC